MSIKLDITNNEAKSLNFYLSYLKGFKLEKGEHFYKADYEHKALLNPDQYFKLLKVLDILKIELSEL